MKVFLTGPNGNVGRGALPVLAKAHEVVALTRTATGAEQVTRAGARPVIGDMTQPGTWLDDARAADAIIHMAQATPKGRVSRAAALAVGVADGAAIEALIGAAAGKVLLYTSGSYIYGDIDAPAVETRPTNAHALIAYKPRGEKLVLDGAAAGKFTGMVARLGPVIGPWGIFEERMFGPARLGKKVSFIGGGAQRESYIHAEDVGRAYLKLLESPQSGSVTNVGGETLTAKEFARTIMQVAGVSGEPGSVPGLVIKLFAGGVLAECLLTSHPLDCSRLAASGFKPAYPTVRDAVAACLSARN